MKRKLIILWGLAAWIFLLVTAGISQGRIIYVDDDANGLNDGTSWENAYKFLQDALADANSVDKPVEIWVAQGTYRPDEDTLHPGGTGNRESAFQLINGVTIKGGYAGFGESNPNARGIKEYETILSGDIGTPSDANDNCYHVFYHPEGLNLDDTAILDGLTITGGNANGSFPHNCGGGMYNEVSSPTVEACTFTENSAKWGGGMCNEENSSPAVNNCIFNGNLARWSGGGMENDYDSSPSVNNCTFSGNTANAIGGGMYNYYSSPTVQGCTFSANVSGGDGGGMRNEVSSPMVVGCTFSGNSVYKNGAGMDNYYYSSPTVIYCAFTNNAGTDYGGGMDNHSDCSPIIINCTFKENAVIYRGGGMSNFYSNTIAEGCTFIGNSANYYGGGMYNEGSSTTVKNCTFNGNSSSSSGGGIYNKSSSPKINNCTFSGNLAIYYGGGMRNYEHSSPTVNNCILWADAPSEIDGPTPTVTYSDLQGGWPGKGNIDTDPMFVNPDSNDFHLRADSPCINAGDPRFIAGPNETDMDGERRVINGRVDIGADEFNYEGPFLEISPRKFDFYCPEGGPNPEVQVLSILIRGTDSSNWNVMEDCFWLQANPAAGSSSGEIDEVVLSVDVNGLEGGEYSCILTVSSPDVINTPQYVTVNLHVKTPLIEVNPTKFEFPCPVGGPNPQPQILSIRNASIGILNWQINKDCSWLQVNPAVGSSAGEVDEVTLSVDANGFGAGEYSCILTVSSPDAINTPQYVTVNLHVKKPLIGVKPTEFEFSRPGGNPNPKPQILSIWNADIGTLNWQITEDCSWLEASPTTGSSTGDINKVTLTFDAAGLPYGHYTCDLTVSDDAASNSPVTVPVTLIIYPERQLYVPADFSTIQDAINDANNGDTIIVADGIYTGNGNCDIDFRRKAITVCSENGPENCIIDCNGTEGKLHTGFLFHSGEDVNAVLDGFTITNGYATGGGGIFCMHHSSPTITNCTISGNKSKGSGGGVCCMENSSPRITNCSIIGNSSEYDGGGIICRMSSSSPTITNCTISGNKSKGSGGGISCMEGSNPTISNCSIIGNSSERDGGGIVCVSSSPTITNCIISGNKSKHYGGGMFNGGIFGPNPGNPTVTNCIFTANRAYYGGGMYNPSSSSTVTNCILWADVPSEIYGGTPIVTYSNVQGGWTGVGNINADPCFADPNNEDYHLKSQAGRWDADEGRWTKDEVTSLCIDGGDPASPIGLEPFPNGGIINMGAYGGTEEASKSYFGEPVCETIVAGDINGDCIVNLKDFAFMAFHWLEER